MYSLYLDESGNSGLRPSKPLDNFFVLGGVLVKEENYFPCLKGYDDLKQTFPESIREYPLHAVQLHHVEPRGENRTENPLVGKITPNEGKTLLTSAYNQMAKLPMEALAVIIDNYQLAEQYGTRAKNPYDLAYTFLLEKFEKIIEARRRTEPSDIFGIVNLSQASTPLKTRIESIHTRLVDEGTEYVKFRAVFRKVNIQPMRSSRFFEFADIACFTYKRAYYAYLLSHLSPNFKPIENYIDLIENNCKLITFGKVKIHGKINVKIFPDFRQFEKQ